MKTSKLLHVFALTIFMLLNWATASAQDKFKECIHFKIKDTSSIVLPDYDTTFSTTYPYIQYLIDSVGVVMITRPYINIPEAAFSKIYFIKFEDTTPTRLSYLISELQSKSWIEFAEIIHISKNYSEGEFNDHAWHYNQIRFQEAVNSLPTDSSNIVIAVIDDGFNLDHEDIVNALYKNQVEVANGIDDDSNGYVDDITGWDAADNDNNANMPNTYPGQYSKAGYTNHGSMVSGICCAEPNNGKGFTGHSYGGRLMPIKLKANADLDDYRKSFSVPISFGLAYAVVSNADIINLSLGYLATSATVVDSLIIDYGYRQGKIWVAAAGNHNNNYSNGLNAYPSSFTQCISVGAINSQIKKAVYSNYEPKTRIDVFAPGTCLPSIESISDIKYSFGTGTSAAAPVVCGAIAQLKLLKPTINVDSVRHLFQKSCTNIDFLNPAYAGGLGSGLIDFYAFVNQNISYNVFAKIDKDRYVFCQNDLIEIECNRPKATNLKIEYRSSNGTLVVDTLINDNNFSYQIADFGFYNAKITVVDSLNNDSVLFERMYKNFFEVKDCNDMPQYNSFSNWNFGKKAGLKFDDSGVMATFGNNHTWVGIGSSVSDYSGNFNFAAGYVSDTSNAFKIANAQLNPGAIPFTNFKIDVLNMNRDLTTYNGVVPFVNHLDTLGYNWIVFSDCLDQRDLSDTSAELLHVRINKLTKSVTVNPLKINGYGLGDSSSWVGNGVQIFRNKTGTGNFILFFGDRLAYYAANKVYIAFMPDSSIQSLYLTDSVALDVYPLDESINYLKASNYGDYFFARQTGFEIGSFLNLKSDQILVKLNTETGKVQTVKTLQRDWIDACSFSPDLNYFYSYELESRSSEHLLFQHNLIGDSIDSERLLYNGDAAGTGMVFMQNGPDNRIYISHDDQPYVHSINLPENRDSFGYSQSTAVKHNHVNLQVVNPYNILSSINLNIGAYGGLPTHCFDSAEYFTNEINYYYVGCDSIRFYNDGPNLQKWYFQGNERWGKCVIFPLNSVCYSDLEVNLTFMGKWTKLQVDPQYPDFNFVLNSCSNLYLETCIGKNKVYFDGVAVDSNSTTYNLTISAIVPKKVGISFCDTFFEKNITLPKFLIPDSVVIYPGQAKQFKIDMQPFWNLNSSSSTLPIAYRNGVVDSTGFTNDSLVGDTAYISFRKPGVYSIWTFSSCTNFEVADIEVHYGCDSTSKYNVIWDNPYTGPGSTSLANSTYLVRGNWNVSNLASLNINNCVFVFDSCSFWSMGDNSILNITNSTFTSCKTWAGLSSLSGSSQLTITSSDWSFAKSAIAIREGKLTASYNTFGSNENDIKVSNSQIANLPLIQYNKFNNSHPKAMISCNLQDTTFALQSGKKIQIMLRNTDGAKVASNVFTQNRPTAHESMNLFLQNTDSMLFQINALSGNNNINTFASGNARYYNRENTYIKNSTFQPNYYSHDTVYGSFCVLYDCSKARVYDNEFEKAKVAVEYYSPNQVLHSEIRNNSFTANRFGILAASHVNPTDTGSSSFNGLSDSVYCKVFCNDFTHHYLAFGGVGKFPVFEGKRQYPNILDYKAANYFYYCDNAFFIRSEDTVDYSCDTNMYVESPYLYNININANLFFHDSVVNDLTKTILNKYKIINSTIEYCGADPTPMPLSIENVNTKKAWLKIFPNPANAVLQLSSNIDKGVVAIYDVTGELKSTWYFENNAATWNTVDMPNGIYFIQIKTATDSSIFTKVIICHD